MKLRFFYQKSLRNHKMSINHSLMPLNLSVGNGIRTHEHESDRILSPAPLTRLGNPDNIEIIIQALIYTKNKKEFIKICLILNFKFSNNYSYALHNPYNLNHKF